MKKICKNIKLDKKAKPIMVSLVALSISAFATNGIAATSTDMGAVKNNSLLKTVMNLSFNKTLKVDPKISVHPDANHIVLDFVGVDRTFVPPKVQNDPLIANVSTKLVDNNIRMLVETKQPVKFKFIKQDNQAVFLIEEAEQFVNESTGEVFVKKENKLHGNLAGLSNNWSNVSSSNVSSVNNVATSFTEITKINLKKDENSNAKLTIDTSGNVETPSIKKEGNKLILDFKNVSIPNELQRRVSTESVGVVTQALDVSMQKSSGRIILEQKDLWDYSFYQVQNKFVIQVKSVETKEEEKKYIGKPLTISFQDMEVRAILQVIADFTGLNIMSSDKVTGTMSIRLKDVPWDQALDLVLESRGLQKVKDGNVIWIATSQEVAANNKAKIDLKSQNEELGDLKLEFFQINYYKADDLKKVIENSATGANGSSVSTAPGGAGTANGPKKTFLSSKGTVGVDARNNVLFIQDTEEKLKELRKLIKKLDIANKQVLVEAKIVIADSDFGRQLGAKFGIRSSGNKSGARYGIGANLNDSNALAQSGGLVNTAVGAAINPLSNFAIGAPAGAIALTLLNATQNGLGIELSALESNNKGKVLSNPRLLTADNKKAVIRQGTQIPYTSSSGGSSGATQVQFKDAVLQLEVTPQIAPNGKVVLDLNIRKDSVGQYVQVAGGGSQPAIDTKNIETTVTVNNGQTVVLGGVYEISSNEDLQKIPFLGDIPFLGNLFKQTGKTETKGELMIFITPHVIEEADLDSGEAAPNPEIELSKK